MFLAKHFVLTIDGKHLMISFPITKIHIISRESDLKGSIIVYKNNITRNLLKIHQSLLTAEY